MKVHDRINTKIRGKLQSKYNLPKVSYLKEEESSHLLNITKFIFFYDDLEANLTLQSQTAGPNCMGSRRRLSSSVPINLYSKDALDSF